MRRTTESSGSLSISNVFNKASAKSPNTCDCQLVVHCCNLFFDRRHSRKRRSVFTESSIQSRWVLFYGIEALFLTLRQVLWMQKIRLIECQRVVSAADLECLRGCERITPFLASTIDRTLSTQRFNRIHTLLYQCEETLRVLTDIAALKRICHPNVNGYLFELRPSSKIQDRQRASDSMFWLSKCFAAASTIGNSEL